MAFGRKQPYLIVHHIPPGVDEIMLENFFNSRKNGGTGDVESVYITYPLDRRHSSSAKVVFASSNTVRRVCGLDRYIKGTKLVLQPESIQDLETETMVQEVCIKHPGKELCFMCTRKNCGASLICIDCVRQDHNGHDWVCAEDQMKRIKAELANLVKTNKELRQKLETLRQQKQEANFGRDKIAAKWDKKKKALNEAEKKCSQELKEIETKIGISQKAQSSVTANARGPTGSFKAEGTREFRSAADFTAPSRPANYLRPSKSTGAPKASGSVVDRQAVQRDGGEARGISAAGIGIGGTGFTAVTATKAGSNADASRVCVVCGAPAVRVLACGHGQCSLQWCTALPCNKPECRFKWISASQ